MKKIKYYTFVQYSQYHFNVITEKKYFSTLENVKKYLEKKYHKKIDDIVLNEKTFLEPYDIMVTETEISLEDQKGE